jgi:LytS/YehU family sensor histidine kinase
MLIQPYAENSMRHGLRHKTSGKGFIRIVFVKSEDSLTVTVEDNGIGREIAARYKTSEHIEYQSRGMTLTAERISMMNTIHGEGIGVTVVDLTDTLDLPSGTRVIVRFPLFDSNIKSDSYDKDRIG